MRACYAFEIAYAYVETQLQCGTDAMPNQIPEDATESLIVDAEARRLDQRVEQLQRLISHAMRARDFGRAFRYRKLWAVAWTSWGGLTD